MIESGSWGCREVFWPAKYIIGNKKFAFCEKLLGTRNVWRAFNFAQLMFIQITLWAHTRNANDDTPYLFADGILKVKFSCIIFCVENLTRRKKVNDILWNLNVPSEVFRVKENTQ